MQHLKKKLLVVLYIFFNLSLYSATYYVSPSGSDSNAGTISKPFFTLNKAWTVISAGDIVYMRGGTYSYNTTTTLLQDKSGTSGNTIKIWAYPGEYPVIDYSGVSLTGQKIGLRLHNLNYVHIKGVRISNMAQQNTSNAWPHYGVILYDDVSDCILENIEVDHIGGIGFVIADNCNNNLFLNCDSHHNQDPYSSSPYGSGDGFQSGSLSSTNNIFRGCRSWWNSDDGWDLRMANGEFTIENCWSFWNGFIPGTWNRGGNGVGMKIGGPDQDTDEIKRIVKNSLVFNNVGSGIESEPQDDYSLYGTVIYNCTVYDNCSSWGDGIVAGGYGASAVIRNCISYNNNGKNAWMKDGAEHDYNNFDIPKTTTDGDFISVNSTGVDGPRQSDGSLPDLNFLKLATGSDLIDAGVNVGIPSKGTAPDLGAFETLSATTGVEIPVYTSSVIENSTPSSLVMTYNMTLANIVPATSAFTVKVNSVSRTVNTVAINGAKVILTLSSEVAYGDIITVAYTKPSLKPLQTVAGGIAESLSAKSVTNNLIASTVPVPVFSGAVIKNASPSLLEMTYSLSLANNIPVLSSFTVLVNSAVRGISSVTVSGTKVILTLASGVIYGDVVKVSYTKPSVNPLQTTSGGQAASINSQSVTNECLEPDPLNPLSPPVPGDELIPDAQTDNRSEVEIQIYPNPASSFVNISIENGPLLPKVIKIYDLTGKIVFNEIIEKDINELQVPISLNQGIYIITLESERLILFSQKLIINN